MKVSYLPWELNWASVKWHDLYPEKDVTLKEENKNFLNFFLLKMKGLILFKNKMQIRNLSATQCYKQVSI